MKSSERFCSMQIQTVEDVRANLGEQKRGRRSEKERDDVKQREKRNKSESRRLEEAQKVI